MQGRPGLVVSSSGRCQLGNLERMRAERQASCEPQAIAKEVLAKVKEAGRNGERIDYLTFVPDDEPTLDICLGQEIAMPRPLGIPIAVITNASLISRADVREALTPADWVSLKIDAADEHAQRKVDRPQGRLTSVIRGNLLTEDEVGQAWGAQGLSFERRPEENGALLYLRARRTQ